MTADSSFKYLGTAVVYKIYANASTMVSNIASVSAVNSESNYGAAATKLIETFGYQHLGTSSGSVIPLIEGDGNNKRVWIRLTSYGTSPEYQADIRIDGKSFRKPRRSENDKFFDFGRAKYTDSVYGVGYNSTNCSVPEGGDADYSSGSVSSGLYYVDLYAFAYGQDTTFSKTYSTVLHLGNVTIDSTKEDN